MLKEKLAKAWILIVLFFAGCSSIPQQADKARYEAVRPAYEELAVPAVKAGTLKQEDFTQMERLFDAWKGAIDAREK